MFVRCKKDINNWTGFESRILSIRNIDHMNFVIDTLNNRAVKVKGSYMNVDKVTWNEAKRELEFFEFRQSGELKSINIFRIVKEAKYIYIREGILLEGFGHDEEGIPEEADVIGIKINVLTSLKNGLDDEFLAENWIDREEKDVFANFKYNSLDIEEFEDQ